MFLGSVFRFFVFLVVDVFVFLDCVIYKLTEFWLLEVEKGEDNLGRF